VTRLALENVRYVRNACAIFPRTSIRRLTAYPERARHVLGESIELLERILRRAVYSMPSRTNVRRDQAAADGGRGLEGVVAKSDDYYNPATELLEESA